MRRLIEGRALDAALGIAQPQKCREDRPRHQGIEPRTLPRLPHAVTPGQHADFAQVQLAHTGLDLGAVADHHPHQAVRYDHLRGGFRHVRQRQRAHLRGVGLIVVVGELYWIRS